MPQENDNSGVLGGARLMMVPPSWVPGTPGDWGVPSDATLRPLNHADRLRYFKDWLGKNVIAPIVGVNWDEQVKAENKGRINGQQFFPIAMPGGMMKALRERAIVNQGEMGAPTVMAQPRSPGAPAPGASIEGRVEAMSNASKSNALNRRMFMKTAAGGALAAKALLSGEGAEQAPKVIADQLGEAATAATPPLGTAPVRVYERVGNKFILQHEIPQEGLGAGELTAADMRHEIGNRPNAAIRPVETDIDHPEHQLLAEPGSVTGLHPRISNSPTLRTVASPTEVKRWSELAMTNPDYLSPAEIKERDDLWKKVHSDPYHARLLDSQKQHDALTGDITYGTDTPESRSNLQNLQNLDEHQTHSYIVEKPVRVRYYEQGRNPASAKWQELEDHGGVDEWRQYENSVHPEVYKLPFDAQGEIIHDAHDPKVFNTEETKFVPRLVGSGDNYTEALDKARSFLHDIGVDPKDVKMSGGSKVVKMELPNGDMIEIREKPTLRPGYEKRTRSPRKGGLEKK